MPAMSAICCAVHGAVGAEQERSEPAAFLLAEEVAALRFACGGDRAFRTAFHHDRLLGGADRPVIESFAGKNALYGERDIRAFFDKGGAVARPDTERGVARGVCCAHHGLPAGCQDDTDVPVGQKGVGGFHCGQLYTADRAFRRTGPAGGLFDDAEGFQDAALCAGMRAYNNRVARFERNQALVHGGRGGVGRRDQRRDHPHRHADFDHLARRVVPQDADHTGVFDVLPDDGAAKLVLQRLVLPPAKAGFLNCHAGERLCLPRADGGDRFADGVQLLL